MEPSIAGKVREYIIVHTHVDQLDHERDIFESGLVNSLFAIELMTFLEQSFAIKVTMDDLDLTNFSSVHNITRFIEQKLQRDRA